jgi:hypothetical protein
MRILCNILVVLFVTTTAVGQQINPVPDYIFRNSMSVGRNAPTDTSAYFSIGPRFGATRGFMPPMVTDTASVTGTKRNGLLIYSIQRNSFLYWDSTGMRWSRIAANLDTLLLSTRAWRQKGIDSLASVRIGGSGTINRVPKFTASGTIGDGSIADSSSSVQMTILSNGFVGINEVQPKTRLDVRGQVNALGGTDNGGYMINWESATRFARLNAGANALDLSHNYKVFTNTQDNASNPSYSMQLNSVDDYFIVQRMAAGGSTMSPIIRSNNNGETLFGTADDNGDFRIQVSGNQYVSGNIAIGTTSDDGYRTNISGTLRTTGATWLGTTTRTVGIGTTTFTGGGASSFAQLLTSGSSGGLIINSDSGNINRIWFVRKNGINDNEGLIRYNTGSFNMDFATAAQVRLTIFGNGRVGINTTTDAGYQFDVAGSMRNTTSAFFNTSSGESYFGTTSDAGDFRVQVAGNIKTTGDIDIGGDNVISSSGRTFVNMGTSGTTRWYSSGAGTGIQFYPNNVLGMFIDDDNELMIAPPSGTVDSGDYKIQVFGNTFTNGSITTSSPSSGSKKPWKLGEAATVSPTSPNRTIRVEIDGVVYYIHAKTTND